MLWKLFFCLSQCLRINRRSVAFIGDDLWVNFVDTLKFKHIFQSISFDLTRTNPSPQPHQSHKYSSFIDNASFITFAVFLHQIINWPSTLSISMCIDFWLTMRFDELLVHVWWIFRCARRKVFDEIGWKISQFTLKYSLVKCLQLRNISPPSFNTDIQPSRFGYTTRLLNLMGRWFRTLFIRFHLCRTSSFLVLFDSFFLVFISIPVYQSTQERFPSFMLCRPKEGRKTSEFY